MPKRSRAERNHIAHRRLRRVLNQHTVANARTLEQKISDAGPSVLRIDPHILTRVRNTMHRAGELSVSRHTGIDWYALPHTDPDLLQTRLELQAETLISPAAAVLEPAYGTNPRNRHLQSTSHSCRAEGGM
jgi:hypothetical protein